MDLVKKWIACLRKTQEKQAETFTVSSTDFLESDEPAAYLFTIEDGKPRILFTHLALPARDYPVLLVRSGAKYLDPAKPEIHLSSAQVILQLNESRFPWPRVFLMSVVVRENGVEVTNLGTSRIFILDPSKPADRVTLGPSSTEIIPDRALIQFGPTSFALIMPRPGNPAALH